MEVKQEPTQIAEDHKEDELEAEEGATEGEESQQSKMEGVASIALLPNGSISGHFVHLPDSVCYGIQGTGVATAPPGFPIHPPLIPETQFVSSPQRAPSPPKKPKTKRERKGGKNKEVVQNDEEPVRKRAQWFEVEEVALAKSWIDISEDPTYSSNQRSTAFWERVNESFHKYLDRTPYRSTDALSSKWSDLKTKVGKFIDMYNHHMNNQGSGWNDGDVYDAANRDYRDEKGCAFPHNAAWKIMRGTTKWRKTSQFRSSKKSKKTSKIDPTQASQSSDGRCFVDGTDVDLAKEFDEELPRLLGRDQPKEAKRKEKEHMDSSGKDTTKLEDMLADLSSYMKTFIALKEKSLALKETSLKQKKKLQEVQDLQLIMMSADSLPERKKKLLLRKQEKLLKKYEKQAEEDDEDESDN